MKKKTILRIGGILVATVAVIGIILATREKPWPVLPDYPKNRAQQFNLQTTEDAGTRITTFEVNELPPSKDASLAVLLNYSSSLREAGWYENTFGLKEPVFYYIKDSVGISLFGLHLFDTCPTFKIKMSLDQFAPESGLIKVTLSQTRLSCSS